MCTRLAIVVAALLASMSAAQAEIITLRCQNDADLVGGYYTIDIDMAASIVTWVDAVPGSPNPRVQRARITVRHIVYGRPWGEGTITLDRRTLHQWLTYNSRPMGPCQRAGGGI